MQPVWHHFRHLSAPWRAPFSGHPCPSLAVPRPWKPAFRDRGRRAATPTRTPGRERSETCRRSSSGRWSSAGLTCFMFFGQSRGLFWRGAGEPVDVETAVGKWAAKGSSEAAAGAPEHERGGELLRQRLYGIVLRLDQDGAGGISDERRSDAGAVELRPLLQRRAVTRRWHSSLGCVSPTRFETQHPLEKSDTGLSRKPEAPQSVSQSATSTL
jgi:hypothetical protein